MARFGISIDQERILREQMQRMGIFERDLEESFIRASGPGGQNVNKVASCVALKHVPTNIIVKCQDERSQGLNRYRARLILIEKISKVRYEEKLKDIQRKEKIRRQKRKRPLAVKEGILESKHHQAKKKKFRQKLRIDQGEET